MHSTTLSGAAVLLAFAPMTLAVGTARVVNNCAFPVYFAPVAQGVFTPMSILPAGGYAAAYSLPNVGVSVKFALSPSSAPTQFEYTWANGKINYDISNIDGNPFAQYGTSLAPSMAGDSNNPSCQVVNCPAGESYCAAAYNQPDDTRTMVCDQASDLVMTLCTGSSSAATTRSADPEPVASTSEDSTVATSASWHGHSRVHARHLPKK